MNIRNDFKILTELKADSTKAFDLLFKEYHYRVFKFAEKLLKSTFEAEEVVQEVFIAVWENRYKIDPSREFSSYLFGIAKNLIYNINRKKVYHYHYLSQLENQSPDSIKSTEEQVDFSEASAFFLEKMEQLPTRRKEIFYLSRNENLSYKQIADKLNISENTVDTQIRNVLNFLRKEFLKNFIFF